MIQAIKHYNNINYCFLLVSEATYTHPLHTHVLGNTLCCTCATNQHIMQ